MKHVLHILKKDVRCLWYELSLSVLLTVGMAVLQLYATSTLLQILREVSKPLAVLAWVLLVVQLVQADALVGTEHDWRTRPIRRRDLMAAKVAFVLLFIGVPMVVGDVIVLVGNGFSPAEFLPGMLWKLLLLSVVILLPAAALAAITRNVPQALLAALATALVVVSGLAVSYSGQWGGTGWVRGAWMALAGFVVAVGVVWLQYARHRTVAARVLAVGGTCLVALTTAMFPWAVGIGVQNLFATETADGVKVILRPGGNTLRANLPRVPISIIDLPHGYMGRVIRGNVTIDVDGTRLKRDAFSEDDALVFEEVGHAESPARIHATVWLAILARQVRQEFDASEGRVRITGLGECESVLRAGPEARPLPGFSCQHPFRLPAVSSVILRTGSGAEVSGSMSRPADYSPIPSGLQLLPLIGQGANLRDLPPGSTASGSRLIFETWTPVAYVERSFTADLKRLGDLVAPEARR